MSCSRMISRALCILALCSLAALPAMGQLPTIVKGVDLFETAASTGTVVSFASTPIPAGFFCTGSAAFTGTVGLKGVPLTTSPVGVAGTADTVVERLANAVFATGGTSATVPVVVRAMRLTSTANIGIYCPAEGKTTAWRVDSCLCGTGPQPTTNLTLTVDQACGCGVANGTLRLNACLRFTRLDTGQTVGPVSQSILLKVDKLPWCPNGKNDRAIASSFGVDTNCDGQADLQLGGTTNFHPSRNCSNQAADCWTVYASLTHCHENYTNPGAHDHCVNPVCGPRQ